MCEVPVFYEFTDWNEVRQFALDVSKSVRRGATITTQHVGTTLALRGVDQASRG